MYWHHFLLYIDYCLFLFWNLLPQLQILSSSSSPQPPLPWVMPLFWPRSLIVKDPVATASDLLNLSLPQQDWEDLQHLSNPAFSPQGFPSSPRPHPSHLWTVSWTLFAPLSVPCNQSFIPPQSTFQIISPRGPSIDGHCKRPERKRTPYLQATLQPLCSSFALCS